MEAPLKALNRPTLNKQFESNRLLLFRNGATWQLMFLFVIMYITFQLIFKILCKINHIALTI